MALAAKKTSYRFTFGPWNIGEGADPFGPAVRKEVAFAAKIREYKKQGFDGVQMHDDDVVEADLDSSATERGAAKEQNRKHQDSRRYPIRYTALLHVSSRISSVA